MASGGSAPAAPDYVGAAQAQANANANLAAGQTMANRPNITTPWGSMTWSRTTGGGGNGFSSAPVQSKESFNEARYLQENPDVAAEIARNKAQVGNKGDKITDRSVDGHLMRMDPLGVFGGGDDGFDPSKEQMSGWDHYNMFGKAEGRNAYWDNPTAAQDPNQLHGTDQWNLDIGLSPSQQQLFDLQQGAAIKGATARGQLTDQMLAAWMPGMGPGTDKQIMSGANDFDFGGHGVPSQALLSNGGSPTGGSGQPGLFDMGGQYISQRAPGLTSSAGNAGSMRQQAQEAALNFLKPLHQQRQGALESQLANMGLTRGSEAWTNEMRNLQDQFTRDKWSAYDSARQEDQMMFGQNLANAQLSNSAALQGQQMQIAAGNYDQNLQNQRLSQLFALTGSSPVSMPSFPGFSGATGSSAPDMSGALSNQYNAAMQQYGQNNANANATNGALASAAMYAAMMWSDRRLKKDIVPLGDGWYEYEYVWGGGRQVGVMADEVPHAAVATPSGFMMVDYSKV